MAKYLRPKTLFGDNFELYLNEIIVHKKSERNKFANFKQREWDFEKIEKLALED
jgi:Conserved phage C-terminus (Phg_2220_C).